eukprot:s849_g31.t1
MTEGNLVSKDPLSEQEFNLVSREEVPEHDLRKPKAMPDAMNIGTEEFNLVSREEVPEHDLRKPKAMPDAINIGTEGSSVTPHNLHRGQSEKRGQRRVILARNWSEEQKLLAALMILWQKFGKRRQEEPGSHPQKMRRKGAGAPNGMLGCTILRVCWVCCQRLACRVRISRKAMRQSETVCYEMPGPVPSEEGRSHAAFQRAACWQRAGSDAFLHGVGLAAAKEESRRQVCLCKAGSC